MTDSVRFAFVATSRPRLRMGLSLASFTSLSARPGGMFAAVADLARAAENAGYDALFVPDHAMQNDVGGGTDAPMLEAYTLLGALAVITTQVRLGAFVSPTTFRHPALLAKAVTTLDVVSGGRAILGVGAGWDTDEHHRYGIEFPGPRGRMARLEDTVTIARSMFDNVRSSVEVSRTTLRDAVNLPSPVQAHVPILIGGGGELRTLPLVARHADIANISAHHSGTVARKLDVLRRECAEIGRDVATLTTTAFLVPHSASHVRRVADELAALGVNGLVIALTSGSPDEASEYAEIVSSSGLRG